MPGELVFTITVTSLSSVPPATRWAVFFTIPGDTTAYYVSMATDSGTPTFVYGQRGTVAGIKISSLGLVTLYNDLGALNAASNCTADGVITLVLDKSALNLQTGETLQAFLASTAILQNLPPSITGAGSVVGTGENVDSASSRFGYTLIGNDVCASGITVGGSGSSSGGTSAGGTSGGMTSGGGASSGTSTGGTSSGGSSTGGSSIGETSAGSGSTGAASGGGISGGGAFGIDALMPMLTLGSVRRRRKVG